MTSVILGIIALSGALFAVYRQNDLEELLFALGVAAKPTQNIRVAEETHSEFPPMVLTVLQGNEDHSPGVARYSSNSTNPILIVIDQHIRFDTPESQLPESLRVIAISTSTGTIHTLLKSYNVNNEFFANIEPGNYELRVQAVWAELGTHVYLFNVTVTE